MANLDRVTSELADRIRGLQREAAAQGLALTITCGFRQLADQQRLRKDYLYYLADKKNHPWAALAAIPGNSDHGKLVSGKQQDATAVDLALNKPTPANIAKHLELAKRWGLVRTVAGEYWHLQLDPKRGPMPSQPAPAIPAPAPQEADDMSDLTIEYSCAAKTKIYPNGDVFTGGTPFFGTMKQLPAVERQGFKEVVLATAVNKDDPGAGYRMHAQNGNVYVFDAALKKHLGI